MLPCYNEYDNIFILIKQIKNTFNNHLIIIVDDSTTDKIKYKINKYKNIKYFKRKSKSGRGSAVIYGMRKISKEKNINHIVEMDTDLSSHPKELPRNIKIFNKQNLDLLIMSRYLKGSKIINWPFRRRIFSYLSNKLAYFLLQVKVSDYTMGYRIYSKRAVKHIINNCGKIGDGFIVLSEILFRLDHAKFKIKDTKTTFVDREKGSSTVNLKLIFYSLIGLFKLYFIKLKIK